MLPWKSCHIHHNKMSLYHSQECNCIFLCAHHSNACNYGNTSCQFFKRGMPKNQHKYQKETIEFWELVLWGGVKKCVLSQFSMSKIIKIFLAFFIENQSTNLGAYFLLLTFFDTRNFQITLLLKGCHIFDSSPLHQFNNFLWVMSMLIDFFDTFFYNLHTSLEEVPPSSQRSQVFSHLLLHDFLFLHPFLLHFLHFSWGHSSSHLASEPIQSGA